METKLLEYCIDLAETRNFTKTAQKFFISQQNLSYHIKNLEAELGTPLFQRTRQSVTVTPAGETFIAEARQALAHINAAYSLTRRLQKPEDRTLVVGCTGVMAQNKVLSAVQLFMTAEPSVKVDIQHDMRDIVVDQFLRGTAYDLIAILDPSPDFDPQKYHRIRLETGPLMAAVGKNHPLAQKGSVTREELLNQTRISPVPENRPTGSTLVDTLLGGPPARILRANSVNAADMMVACGMGYTILCQDQAGVYRPDQFTYLPIEGVSRGFPIWFVWRRSNRNPDLPRFLELCQKA